MTKLANTLYEIAAEFKEIADRLQDSDLPDEVVRDTLEGCAMDFDNKAIATASLIRNMEATAAAIAEAEAVQYRRRKAIENRISALRSYLMSMMVTVDRRRIECPLFKIAVQGTKASVIIEGEIPDDYLVYPEAPPPRPDKDAIKSAIEAGKEVPGARLQAGQTLVIK